MAGLRKLKGKYYARLKLDGKDKIIPLSTTLRSEAERRLKLFNENEWLVKARLKKEVEIGRLPSLFESVETFLNHKEQTLTKNTTIQHYKYALNHMLFVFGKSIPINNIRNKDLDKLKTCLIEKFTGASVNSYLRAINAFIRWMTKEYHNIKLDTIRFVKVERELPEFLTPEELDAIYSLCQDEKMLATFKVYEHTGIRLRELHNCELDEKLTGNYVKLCKTKSNRDRIIPIPPEVIKEFKLAKADPYKPDLISKTFTRLRKKAGITSNKTLHSLRHTFALRKLLELGNIYLVKEMLGHSDVKTTQKYLEFPNGYLKDVLEKWMPDVKDGQESKKTDDYGSFLDTWGIRNENSRQGRT